MICRRKRICFSAVKVCVTYRARGFDVISPVERLSPSRGATGGGGGREGGGALHARSRLKKITGVFNCGENTASTRGRAVP